MLGKQHSDLEGLLRDLGQRIVRSTQFSPARGSIGTDAFAALALRSVLTISTHTAHT